MFESMDFASLLPTRQTTEERQAQADEPEDDMCSLLPTLTWSERLIGCGTCMVAGYILSFGSFFRIKELILMGNPLPFVLNATVGNIIALCGSCFLSGPQSQMKKMWADTRRTATIAYLGSLFLTLFVAFVPGVPGPRGLYLLLLMICQYVSITWYCLSYIPYAREAVLGFIQRRVNGLMGE